MSSAAPVGSGKCVVPPRTKWGAESALYGALAVGTSQYSDRSWSWGATHL